MRWNGAPGPPGRGHRQGCRALAGRLPCPRDRGDLDRRDRDPEAPREELGSLRGAGARHPRGRRTAPRAALRSAGSPPRAPRRARAARLWRSTLAPDTLLVERRLAGGELERARVTVEKGIPLPGRVPVAVAPVLAALDGRRSLADVVEPRGRRRARLAGGAVGRVHSGLARARRPRPARRRRALKLVEWTLTCTPPSGRLDGLATRRGYPWRTTRRANEEQTDGRARRDGRPRRHAAAGRGHQGRPPRDQAQGSVDADSVRRRRDRPGHAGRVGARTNAASSAGPRPSSSRPGWSRPRRRTTRSSRERLRTSSRCSIVARPGFGPDAAAYCGPAVDVVELPLGEAWLRDSGPVFANRRDRHELVAVDFLFNGWGETLPASAHGEAIGDEPGRPARGRAHRRSARARRRCR